MYFPYFIFFLLLTLSFGVSFHFETCSELSYLKNHLRKYKKLSFGVFSSCTIPSLSLVE